MSPKGTLELTWVGKDERPRLEPRESAPGELNRPLEGEVAFPLPGFRTYLAARLADRRP